MHHESPTTISHRLDFRMGDFAIPGILFQPPIVFLAIKIPSDDSIRTSYLRRDKHPC